MAENKNLKDLLDKESEYKDLNKLLGKFENSYIYKGLDYIDKKYRISEYYPDSKLAKAIDFGKDAVFYTAVLGILPGEMQEKYTEHLGYDKFKFMKYSLAYGFLAPAVKIAVALFSPAPVALGLYAWASLSLADNLGRLAYIAVKKKPIGSLRYTEIPYRVIKPIFKRLRWQESQPDEKKNINPYDNPTGS